MQIDDLVLLLTEKTHKKELPWRREERGTTIQFVLRLDGINLVLSRLGKQAQICVYYYRLDSNVLKKVVPGDFYDFVSTWWDEEVVPTAMGKLMEEISRCQDSPLDRMHRGGGEIPMPPVVGRDEGEGQDWAWQQPVANEEVVAAVDIEGI